MRGKEVVLEHVNKSEPGWRGLTVAFKGLVCCGRPSSEGGQTGRERLSLKWAVPLQEVDVQEDIAPATRNLLASSGRPRNSAGRLVPLGNPAGGWALVDHINSIGGNTQIYKLTL